MSTTAVTRRIPVFDRLHLSMALAIVIALIASGLITYSTGGTSRAFPHLFYIPIILAAWCFKIPGAVLAGLVAGLICGPFMPLNVETGEMQQTQNWLLRSAFFVAVGSVAGIGFQMMENRVQRQERLHEDAVRGFVHTIDAKSPFTAAHSERVAHLAVMIGRELGLEESNIRDLYWAGLLHDVGKLWVDDQVLNKPGPLSDAEWQAIREHPLRSAAFIRMITEFQRYENAARHHHERFDGTGYPDGLAGQQIPFDARVLAAADAFEAMTAARPYRPPLSPSEALQEVEYNAGAQFDPDVARALVSAIESNPDWEISSQTAND